MSASLFTTTRAIHQEMTRRYALIVPVGLTAAKRKAEESPDDETHAKRIKSSESPLPELATTKDAPRAVPFPEKVRITRGNTREELRTAD